MKQFTRTRTSVLVMAVSLAAMGVGQLLLSFGRDFIRHVLDRVGDKWSVLVAGTLEAGPVRYTELAHAIPGISQRMLTLTLQHLAEDGFVTRTSYPEVPPRVEYELTPLGRSLLRTVLDLAAWAVDNHRTIQDHRFTATRVETGAAPSSQR